eukprot:GHUV01048940.1.p1 GENE.GHUV01048940.1~~GHUV01048940.1.p1  ORF type:complete len:116 (+),score=15.43 GHUV01048940.1:22-369(+)
MLLDGPVCDTASCAAGTRQSFASHVTATVQDLDAFMNSASHMAFVFVSLYVQVENFGRMRYERSRDALAHGRILTQRHEATNAEVAMAEGDRPLVGRRAADEDFNLPEPASTQYL